MIFTKMLIGAQRAQTRARPHSARQSILLIKEMLFDYLIAILAQKAAFLGLLENWPFLKKSIFHQNFDFFSKMSIFPK